MLERQMDDGVGGCGGFRKAGEVVEIAAPYRRACGRQRGGRRVRAGEGDNLMTRLQEVGNDRGPNVSGPAGDEHAHGIAP
jgi:hypothetical protein